MVPPRDSDALTKAINTILNNLTLREKYGNYAKERVEREFTREVIIKRVIEIYREMLGDRKEEFSI